MGTLKLTRNMWSIVDDDIEEKVKHLNWFALQCGNLYYAKNNTYGTLHRYIFILDGIDITGKCVDHINRNTLDNRRENLRIVTKRENSRNTERNVKIHSKYIGVCWTPHTNRWAAKLKVEDKTTHLGYFETAEDAGLAYDRAVLYFFGEDGVLNFPEKVHTHDLSTYRSDTRKRLSRRNTTGYRGVTIKSGKFYASIHVGGRQGKNICLGTYDNPVDAANAFDAAFIKFRGFSQNELNFPEHYASQFTDDDSNIY